MDVLVKGIGSVAVGEGASYGDLARVAGVGDALAAEERGEVY